MYINVYRMYNENRMCNWMYINVYKMYDKNRWNNRLYNNNLSFTNKKNMHTVPNYQNIYGK